jgi:Tol biopolymer transport system component
MPHTSKKTFGLVAAAVSACLAACLLADAQGASPGAAAVISLVDVRRITNEEHLHAPRFSPNGLEVLVSRQPQGDLYLVRAADGNIRRLSPDLAAGSTARFTEDGLAVRYGTTLSRTPAWIEVSVFGERRRVEDVPERGTSVAGLRSWEEQGDVFVQLGKNDPVQITDGSDRFFGPVVSPRGNRVAFAGRTTGVHVFEPAGGRRIAVGRGADPVFDASGERLFFDVVEDDGQNVLGSDLYVYDLEVGRRTRLTDTPEVAERNPFPSPDGHLLAFEAGGAIYIGRLAYR